MFIEIKGKCKDPELVEEYVLNLAKKLGLARRKTGEIVITFKAKMPKSYGDSLGLCEGDRTEALITIAKKQTYYEQMRTLAHEMVHAKQFMRGEYPSEREATNREFDLFGRCSPWEKT
jgi:Zn-dependent peptidase ImmA (M78 family)